MHMTEDDDAAPAVPTAAGEVLDALRCARVLVRPMTVRDALRSDSAVEAAGLNPWCVNEGRATGEEPLDLSWLDHAIEACESLVGNPGDPDAAACLEDAAQAADRAATLVAHVTVGQAFDGGEEAIEAAGLNPWCLNEGRASRGDTLGNWRQRAAADAAREAAAAIRGPAFPGSAP